MESKTLAPLSGQNDPEETEVSCSAPSCSPSWSPVRRLMPDHHETWYCLEIQVTLPKEGGATPPPPHAWQAPVVEHMLCDGKSGLTEVIVMGTGWPVLFYGRQSLGEGLSLGEVQDAMFTLSGALSWVGKEAQLTTNPLNLWEGRWLIAQADTKGCIEARGPRHPCSWLPVSPPFGFHSHAGSPQEERLQSTNKCMEEPRHTCLASHHDCTLWQGWDHGQR